MGLDIGFHKETDWAPRPGRKFGTALTAFIGYDPEHLSLTSIRECFAEYSADPENAGHLEQPAKFVEWCEDYWGSSQISPDAGISVIFDS